MNAGLFKLFYRFSGGLIDDGERIEPSTPRRLSSRSRVGCLGVTVCAAIGMFVLATAASQAQGPGAPPMFRGRGMDMGRGMNVVHLLSIEQVQNELQLTPKQNVKLKKLIQQFRRENERSMAAGRGRRRGMGNGREDMQNLSPEERRERFETIMKQRREEEAKMNQKIMDRLTKILDETQLERLKQIQMQLAGAATLLEPEVAEQLKLDETQKQKLQSVFEKARDEMRELMPAPGDGGPRRGNRGPGGNGTRGNRQFDGDRGLNDGQGPGGEGQLEGNYGPGGNPPFDGNRGWNEGQGPGGNRQFGPNRQFGGDRDARRQTMQEMREKMQAVQEKIKTECLAVLTEQQQKQYEEMLGEPFELDRSAFGPPSASPRGEGRRNQGRRQRQN